MEITELWRPKIGGKKMFFDSDSQCDTPRPLFCSPLRYRNGWCDTPRPSFCSPLRYRNGHWQFLLPSPRGDGLPHHIDCQSVINGPLPRHPLSERGGRRPGCVALSNLNKLMRIALSSKHRLCCVALSNFNKLMRVALRSNSRKTLL